MTRYFKVTISVAVPETDDDADDEQKLLEHIEDMFGYGEAILLDSALHEQTLVDSTWLQSVLPDIDDEDDDWWPDTTFATTTGSTPPSAGAPASPPQSPTLNMNGVDPDSPEAEDIREAFIEATTPDPDDPA